MERIDSHQHLWDLDRFPCSWCAGIPALNRSFRLDDYVSAAEGCDIEKAIFMECDVDAPHALDEARHIQSLAEKNPLIAGIIASARPENAGFPRELDELLKLTQLRGLRRVLHVAPDETSQSALFAENVRRLAPHRLTFDICALARQLPIATALVEKCPEVQFVLDHCGMPDVAGQALDPWRDYIKTLAALPNVACKISGVIACCKPENATAEALRPFIEHCIESFGWDRVVWGGDWPVCTLTSTLRHWAAISDELVSSADADNQRKLFHDNAGRIYRLNRSC